MGAALRAYSADEQECDSVVCDDDNVHFSSRFEMSAR